MPEVALPPRIEPDAAAVVVEPSAPATIPALPPTPKAPKTVVKPRPAPPKLEATPVAPVTPRVEPPPASPTRVPAPPQPAPVPAPAKSDDLADYRLAHEAHFRGHDATAALAAWDAYLAKHAKSQMATDARYNRALVLIKLARYADARAALTPFANAPAGSYHQADAVKLLAALPAK
jgi:hypothetical protein